MLELCKNEEDWWIKYYFDDYECETVNNEKLGNLEKYCNEQLELIKEWRDKNDGT